MKGFSETIISPHISGVVVLHGVFLSAVCGAYPRAVHVVVVSLSTLCLYYSRGSVQ